MGIVNAFINQLDKLVVFERLIAKVKVPMISIVEETCKMITKTKMQRV